MQLADLHELYADAWEPPPRPRDLLTFARSLFVPQGELKGMPYDPALHPGQLVFLEAYASGKWTDFVILADTQSGKSWLIQVIAFFATCELKQDVLYGLPDMRFCADVWTKKIKPGLKGSGLEKHLPISGSGSGGGTEIDTIYLVNAGSMNFHGSHARHKGGGNDGRSIPIIINDEGDSLPEDIINKNNRRADGFFRQARRLLASTVKDDDASNITSAYDNSTGTRLHYECPQCKAFCGFEWEQFSYDNTNDKTALWSARIACGVCGYKMDEQQRQTAIRRYRVVHRGQHVDATGAIVGDDPESFVFGIKWSCLDNPFKTMGQIAIWHRAAFIKSELGRNKDLSDFFHDQLGRILPKAESGEDLDAMTLAHRSAASNYARGYIPGKAIFTTAAVDQQKRLLAWEFMAHDLEGRTWCIDWGYENICGPRDEPTPDQRVAALDALAKRLEAGFPVAQSSQVMIPVLIGVDVAAWPAIVGPWIRSRSGWLALHGSGAEQAKLMQRANSKSKGVLQGWYELRTQAVHGGEWNILWLDSDEIKHEVGRAFARPIDATGATMLPAGVAADSDFVRQLTAEEWRKNPNTGNYGWVQVYKYNEALDLTYYNRALGQFFIVENPGYIPPSHISVRPARLRTPNAPLDKSDDWAGGMGAW